MRHNENNEDREPAEESELPTVSSPYLSVVMGGKIGPFKLLSFLGEGGYGIVYLAEQKKLLGEIRRS